jgi:hypothetical protein
MCKNENERTIERKKKAEEAVIALSQLQIDAFEVKNRRNY